MAAQGRQAGAPGPTQAQLKIPLRRLETLRGAARAITPSIGGQPTTSPFDGAELAASLAQLVPRIAALQGGIDAAARDEERRSISRALAEVDQALGAAGIELLRILDGISMIQLRASLPGIARQRRFDALALLDLLVQDQKGILERSMLFDYLATLLASEEQDGKRWVVHDPAALVPRLRLLCQRAESRSGEEAREAEEQFHSAASPERSQEELRPLIERMRKRKQGLGQLLFVPGVLRAVVTYNIAIANRIEDDLRQTKQESDREMLGLTAFVGGPDDLELPPEAQGLDTGAGRGEYLEKAEEVCSVFESSGISAIARAMRVRSEGSTLRTTALERIASRVGVADLNDTELSYLAAVDAEGRECVMGRTVVVGLLSRTALESALDLREIGISPERLREEWAGELDRALQGLQNDCLASNAYEEACALSEVRTRFLYESVSSLGRSLRRPRPSTPPSSARVSHSEDRTLAKEALAAAAAKAVPVSKAAPRHQGLLRKHREALLGWLAVVLSAVALMNMIGTPPGSIQYMGTAELAAISEHLGSGYRNDAGTLFIGTLKEGWQGLAKADQQRVAQEMVSSLKAAGVVQVMAFDRNRRLCVQAVNGKLRLPRASRK